MATPQLEAPVLEPLLAARERFLAFVRARISDPELAEDILQDSLLKAVRAAPAVDDESRVAAWFYRVLQNAIVDAYRRRATETARGAPLDERVVADLAAQPLTPERETELCACFAPLVSTLKPEYAALIRALDLEGEQPDAVAARLGLTPNNLKVRRHRARQALRRRVEETCRVCAEHHCLDCTCQTAEGV